VILRDEGEIISDLELTKKKLIFVIVPNEVFPFGQAGGVVEAAPWPMGVMEDLRASGECALAARSKFE